MEMMYLHASKTLNNGPMNTVNLSRTNTETSNIQVPTPRLIDYFAVNNSYSELCISGRCI